VRLFTVRNIIIFVLSFIVLLAFILIMVFSCNSKEKITAVEEEPFIIIEEQAASVPEENEVPAEIPLARTQGSAQTPASGASMSSLSGLSGRLQGLGVHVSEIDPVNYQNPNIDALRHMGVDQYLISYFEGENSFRENNFDRAILEYTASINSNNRFIEAYVSRANAYMKKREYTRAVEDYSRAISLDSGRAEIYNYRGFARTELRTGAEMNLAVEDFTRAANINRNYVDALVNRSYAYYYLGNYDRAIEDCDRIIALEPRNAAIWNRRGSCFYAKEDDDRAIRDFTQALALNENYAAALFNRASAWYNKRDYDKALADLNRCLSINPSYAAAYASRAKVYEAQGNTVSAAADTAAAGRYSR